MRPVLMVTSPVLSRILLDSVKLGSLASLLVLSCSVFAKAPEFPPPPDSAVEWVAQDIEMNGNRTAIRAYDLTMDLILRKTAWLRKICLC